MYLSAKHIGVKRDQDYSNYESNENYKAFVLCDGIGMYDDSGRYSQTVANAMMEKTYPSVEALDNDQSVIKLKEDNIIGGTTILFCKEKGNNVYIEYLGNGGIIHMNGGFYAKRIENEPFQYSNLMLPHVAKDSSLFRYYSHNSSEVNHIPTKIDLSMNSHEGDILLFYTDGINSLENNVILIDNQQRFWRNESDAVHYILRGLNEFLENEELHIISDNRCDKSIIQTSLEKFNEEILSELKEKALIEDDASLGIVLTGKVIDYYRNKIAND